MTRINKLFVEALMVGAILGGFAIMADKLSAAELEDDTIWMVQPGDNLLASCNTDDCMPSFDDEGHFSNASGGSAANDPKLWECRVVSEAEYETGNYPGGTVCVQISD